MLPIIFYFIIKITAFEEIYKYKLPMHIVFLAALSYTIAVGAVHYLIFIFLFIFSWYIYQSIIFLYQKRFKVFLKFNYLLITLGLLTI